VIEASLVNSEGCLSGISSVKIPRLTTSWYLISRTFPGHALVYHGGLPFWATIIWSYSSLRTPTIGYTFDWRPITLLSMYSHRTACCFLLLMFPVSWTIVKFASWVIFLVAALEALRWTNWWLRSCCLPMSDEFDIVPGNPFESHLLSPGWGGCVCMICWCGIDEEDDNGKKWEVLRTI